MRLRTAARPATTLMPQLLASIAVVSCCVLLNAAADAQVIGVDIATRARGAERVVVGTVVSVQAAFEKNEFGDELIVSHALVEISQELKGAGSTPFVDVDVEGGSVGTITLKVSDLPALQRGDRAVFFLDRRGPTVHVPHLRGLGILKLDARDVVTGSSLTLEQIRSMVRDAVVR